MSISYLAVELEIAVEAVRALAGTSAEFDQATMASALVSLNLSHHRTSSDLLEGLELHEDAAAVVIRLWAESALQWDVLDAAVARPWAVLASQQGDLAAAAERLLEEWACLVAVIAADTHQPVSTSASLSRANPQRNHRQEYCRPLACSSPPLALQKTHQSDSTVEATTYSHSLASALLSAVAFRWELPSQLPS